MSKTKPVQVRLAPDVYKDAKVGLAKLDMSMQEFLETYIKLKFSKDRKNVRQK